MVVSVIKCVSVVSRTDFESTVFHNYLLFSISRLNTAMVVRRLETATGTALAISCKEVFYLPRLLTIVVPKYGRKKTAKLSGCGFARLLWSF